ncbi:protoporphyrinogen oxidase HemJ [Aestuariivirga sp.]|uniref:protoporphyrinogen oxidase HemJ n=1 Tax=Aestuariivirga sp. TaxID=2650926 RepID=UPI0039195AA3
MADTYLWLKAVHILAVIAWMAGLFYLPRLFVYHAENSGVPQVVGTFKIMERRLLKAIMRPAGLVAVVSGLGLIWLGSWHSPVPAWLWLKLALVLGMLGYHGALERHSARFGDDKETASGRYFRIINEIPTLLLIAIVVLVVLKPF